MKKAYRIAWGRRPSESGLDLGCRMSLPWVICHKCGQDWGQGNIEYPAFNFKYLSRSEFNDNRKVTVEEFSKIAKRVTKSAKRNLYICPGGSIGQMYGDAFRTKFDDFAWGRILIPQISKQACELLAKEGVNLCTAEIDIRFRGKPITSHLAIQVDPVALLTSESLENQSIVHCETCGDYSRKRRTNDTNRELILNWSEWPLGQHLVMLRETLDVIASEEFMDAVEKHELTGIVFEECGQFV